MVTSRRALVALATAAVPAGAARAQDFPSRPVTIIAAGAAGGPTDTITRILADSMGRHLGQPVVVEAIGPANVATQRLTQMRPDGHTLMVTNVGMAASATLCPKPAPAGSPAAAVQHPGRAGPARRHTRRRE